MATELVHSQIDDDVYTGFWINRLHKSPYGATLTLGRDHGALLIAFLALYVAASGRGFWKITRFVLHYAFSSTEYPDGIYHQRQALLRNSQSALDTVWELLLVGFAWKHRAGAAGNWKRLWLPLVLALVVAEGFGVAGVLSSRVTSTQANEILLSGKRCNATIEPGWPYLDNYVGDVARYLSEKHIEDLSYATQCYQPGQKVLPRRCQTFTQPRLQYTMDEHAPCPFAGSICQLQDDNLVLDSGYIKSNRDLGINTEPQFTFRARHHCAPLITDGFSELTGHPGDSSKYYMHYYYHQVPEGDKRRSYRTYAVPMDWTGAVYLQDSVGDWRNSYQIGIGSSLRPPISELAVTDSEALHLYFLESTRVDNRNKIKGPWFGNSNRMNVNLNGTSVSLAVGVVACRSKYMFCDADGGDETRCISFTNRTALTSADYARIWPKKEDQAIINGSMTVMRSYWEARMVDFYTNPRLPSLLAAATIVSGTQQSQLPENQWQKELEYTFQAELASFQSSLVENTKAGVDWPDCEPEELCRLACKQQKTRSFEFYSFSVLGLSIILILGLVIMSIGIFLEQIAGWFDRKRHQGKPSYRQLEWETNSTLQLQRLAHESLGFGVWSRPTDIIPVTEKGEEIGIMDFSDQDHPCLRHATETDRRPEFMRLSPEKASWSNRSLLDAENMAERTVEY